MSEGYEYKELLSLTEVQEHSARGWRVVSTYLLDQQKEEHKWQVVVFLMERQL